MATLITKNSSTASAVPAAGDLVKGELAVNVTDKKVYTKDNSAAVVKLVGSLGNQEANAVAVTGGTINGTTIGATTPSTGAFTTASASSGFTGNLTGNVTGNVSGTAANVTGVVAIANGGTGLSALGTGVQSALGQAVTGSGSFVLSTSPSLTTPNLGTPSAAVLTNATGLPLTTGVTGTLGVANGGTGITAFGTGVATALGQNVTGSGGIVLATSPSLTTPNLGTPSAATLTNATGLPISTGVSGLGTGVATALAVATGSAGAFVVNGGALGTPSSGTLTNATGLPLSTGVTGTLATTNGGTGLTSFTANGVVYASSTSALTTGSALTFDGTNLGVNCTATNFGANYRTIEARGATTTTSGVFRASSSDSSQKIDLYIDGGVGTLRTDSNHPLAFAINNAEQMRLTSSGLGLANGKFIAFSNAPSASSFALYGDTSTTVLNGPTGGVVQFNIANSEQMRLTSTGLGIGTSSPAYKLDVNGAIRASGDGSSVGLYLTTSAIRQNTTGGLYIDANATGAAGGIYFRDSSSFTTRLTIDSSGNLGLGVTPSAWYTSYGTKALQFAASGSLHGLDVSNSDRRVALANNDFINTSGVDTYINTGHATKLQQVAGQFHFYTAASGTAGNPISFTQAMTLDASGNLGVGTSSPTDTNGFGRALDLNGPDGAAYYARAGGSGTNFTLFGNYGADGYILNRGAGNLYFYNNNAERFRITSGGDLLVGVTAFPNSTTAGLGYSPSSSYLSLSCGSTTTSVNQVYFTNGNGTVGSISTSGTATAYNTSSDYRLKNNPQPLTGSGAFIDALQPKTWNWATDGSKGVGFIAHEVQEVSPGSVVGTKDAVDEEGKPIMQAMEYGSAEFIANIIAELQSLRARVAQLEAK